MTTGKKLTDNGPQVPIDAGRLRTAIAASKRSLPDILCRVKKCGVHTSRQHLYHHARSGKHCSQNLRTALARVLRVPVQWLAGEAVSTPSFLNLRLEAELGEPTHLDRHGSDLGFSLKRALPARSELEAVNLVRVLAKLRENVTPEAEAPSALDQLMAEAPAPAKEGAAKAAKNPLESTATGQPFEATLLPSRALLRYAYGLLHLELWRIYLGAGTDVSDSLDSEDFTLALAEAVRVLLRPWTGGKRKISTDGLRSLRQIGDMLMATTGALQRSDGTDLVSWQTRLTVLSQLSTLYTKACAMPLADSDDSRLESEMEKEMRRQARAISYRSWTSKVVRPLQKAIRKATYLVGGAMVQDRARSRKGKARSRGKAGASGPPPGTYGPGVLREPPGSPAPLGKDTYQLEAPARRAALQVLLDRELSRTDQPPGEIVTLLLLERQLEQEE